MEKVYLLQLVLYSWNIYPRQASVYRRMHPPNHQPFFLSMLSGIFHIPDVINKITKLNVAYKVSIKEWVVPAYCLFERSQAYTAHALSCHKKRRPTEHFPKVGGRIGQDENPPTFCHYQVRIVRNTYFMHICTIYQLRWINMQQQSSNMHQKCIKQTSNKHQTNIKQAHETSTC